MWPPRVIATGTKGARPLHLYSVPLLGGATPRLSSWAAALEAPMALISMQQVLP